MEPFIFARTPAIRFGIGIFAQAPNIVSGYGRTVLLVTGRYSFVRSRHFEQLTDSFSKLGVSWHNVSVEGEPSPDMIDRVSAEFRYTGINVVLAVGGGSVIDAGKAISAMLPREGSVFDYLEGVGAGKEHDGSKIPFIAVPTTAGTGSEATKNAVLSRVGPGGFKKSLRHDNFIPDHALVDPELTVSCPADVTAACGMDAFTQLLESFVSIKASPLTDGLARSGMTRMKSSLTAAYANGATDISARADISYGALISGITLTNAGLGVVHGLASTIGGRWSIPHGVICGVLLEPVTRMNIRRLQEMGESGFGVLNKYAEIGRLVGGDEEAFRDRACDLLLECLAAWRCQLRLPLLSDYGLSRTDIPFISENTRNGNNPVKLTATEVTHILESVIEQERFRV